MDSEDVFEYVWKLSNLFLLNPHSNPIVETSEFEIPFIPLTRWTLGYRLKADKDVYEISYFLKRSENDDSKSSVSVKFKLTLSFGNNNLECNFPSSSYITREFCKNCVENYKFKASKCDMIPVLQTIIKFEVCEVTENLDTQINDLEVLSRDISNLFENAIIPDTKIVNKEKVFNVHMPIIFARCPKLFSNRNLEEYRNECFSLKHLLRYIYSGCLCMSDSDTELDICDIAHEFEMPSLIRCLSDVPLKLQVDSQVHSYSVSYVWSIKNFSKYNSNQTFLSPLIKLIGNTITQWRLVVYLQKCSGYEKVIIGLRNVSSKPHDSTYVHYKVCIVQDRGQECFDLVSSHLFSERVEHIFPLNITKQSLMFNSCLCLPNDTLTFKYSLSISDGTISFNTYELYCRSEESKKVCYHILSDDLSELYRRKLFSDVVLVVQSKRFEAHKAILSARSPVFSRMFQIDMVENRTNEVLITDADEETIGLFLQYIYTAKLSLPSDTTALNLYNVADKYQVLILKGKCDSYLKGRLNCVNFKDIFV